MPTPPSTRASRSAPVRREVEQVMGMPVSLAVRGRHAADSRGHEAWLEAVEVLREADRVFSTYRPDSPVSRLGRGEVRLDECPPEVAEVLGLAERARRDSAGAFDVRRMDPDGTWRLDPSGVVKGWAVERAAEVIQRLPDTDFCLSAGGDLVCRVAARTSPAWRVGIEDPLDPSRMVAVIPVRSGAVATSGLHRRGDHIVDGRTGRTPRALASVTVVHASLTWADIDATTAFALGADGPVWLRSRPGRCGVVVWADGTAETYDGEVA